MPDEIEPLKLNKKNWVYPEIPEERVDQKAIEYVAAKLKIDKRFVAYCHDYQWRFVYEQTKKGKNVMVAGMFRLLITNDNLTKLETQLIEELEALKKKKAIRKNGMVKDKNPYRRKVYALDYQDLILAIESKQEELKKVRGQIKLIVKQRNYVRKSGHKGFIDRGSK